MDYLRVDQVVTLALFLAALGLIWWWVKRHQAGLSGRLAAGKRIRVAEVTALSPVDRAMLLQVDGREFLLLRLRGAAPLLQDLSAPVAKEAQE